MPGLKGCLPALAACFARGSVILFAVQADRSTKSLMSAFMDRASTASPSKTPGSGHDAVTRLMPARA